MVKEIDLVLICFVLFGFMVYQQLYGIYIQQLCDDTGCNPEYLPEAMNDREMWRERGSGISVLATWHDDDDDDDDGISAIVGFLISNPLYTYILNMYDL